MVQPHNWGIPIYWAIRCCRDKHIATVDADGVALAAIQGLSRNVQELRSELARRDVENVRLQQRLGDLEKLVQNLSRKGE